jgi:hypothetical protein
LLSPHSICSWIDLKIVHSSFSNIPWNNNTIIKSVQLQTERQRATAELRKKIHIVEVQIPEAGDKTTIQVLIQGLTLGPIALHLTRKEPKSIDELFHKSEEYIKFDEDHRRRIH